MKKLFKIIWTILSIAYIPIYLAFRLYYIVVRCLLAFAYLGMLEFKIAKDTLKLTFTNTWK